MAVRHRDEVLVAIVALYTSDVVPYIALIDDYDAPTEMSSSASTWAEKELSV